MISTAFLKTLINSHQITQTDLASEWAKISHTGKTQADVSRKLNKEISTHTFRRSFGRRFMESVGDINKLREIFGHSNTKTTELYIGWEPKEIAEAMSRVVF